MLGGMELRHDRPVPLRAAAGAGIYSVATNQWKVLDELPFSDRLLRPGGVWAGDRLIVAGVPCAADIPERDTDPFCPASEVEVASYSPTTGTWTKLTGLGEKGRSGVGPPPIVTGLGWTGTHAVFTLTYVNGNRYLLMTPRSTDGPNCRRSRIRRTIPYACRAVASTR